MHYSTPPPDKDPKIWELAHRRVSFKYHLGTYFIVNAFFWIIWYFSGEHSTHNGWPWPIWPMIGWGIGLFFHFMGAYVYPQSTAVEREYERLKQNQNK